MFIHFFDELLIFCIVFSVLNKKGIFYRQTAIVIVETVFYTGIIRFMSCVCAHSEITFHPVEVQGMEFIAIGD